MKKGLLLGGALAIAGLAITPKYIGMQTAESLHQHVAQISQTEGYQADITELQQGWFSTRATINLEVSLAGLTDSDDHSKQDVTEVEVQLDVNHGPLLFSNIGTLGIADWTATVEGEELREYLSWEEHTPFYQLQGVTGLSGNSQYQDKISAFKGTEVGQLASLNFSGYLGGGELSDGNLRYHGVADSLTIQSDEVQVEGHKLAINLEAETYFTAMLRGDFYNSDTLFTLQELAVSEPEAARQLTLDDLKFRARSQVNDDRETGDMLLDYRLANISMPDFSATDVHMAMEVKQISLDFLKAYQEFARSLSKGSDENIEQASQNFILDNLLMVLTPEPEMNITTLRGNLPEGSFSGHMNTKLVNIDSLPKNLADKGFWLSHALGDAQIQMDKAVAERFAAQQVLRQLQASVPPQQWDQAKMETLAKQQAPVMLKNLEKQGMISQTEEGYQVNFSLQDGQANLNGKVIPLPL